MLQQMPAIAAIRANQGEPVDTLFAEVAATLRRFGLRIGGIVQEEHRGAGGVRPVTRLRDLSDGSIMQISQDLGPHARGCRLDPGALAAAARRLEDALATGVDFLILNRFGKSEAEGTGLRPIFEQAIVAGVPVLTAVRAEYVDAWEDFHEGMASSLPVDPCEILAWCHAALRPGRAPAYALDATAV